MKKLLSFVIAILWLINGALAQTQVSGIILGPENEPIVGAAVLRLAEKDSTMQAGTVTDVEGRFTLDAAETGPTLLRIQAVGHATRTLSVKGSEAGTLKLDLAAKQLKEAVVIAKKPILEMKDDRMILNVEGSVNAQGNNGLELLRKAPGVVVDNNENIQLRGKSSVRILIDGKPSQLGGADLATQLKALQASDIEAIEIITNPSAKYEAQGSGGVINIKLKKNKSLGTNGNLVLTGIQGAYFPKANENLSLNHRSKKLNLFGSVGANQGKYQNQMYISRYQSDTLYQQESKNISNNHGLFYKGGADWFITDKHTLGISANGNTNSSTSSQTAVTQIFPDNGATTPIRVLTALNDNASSNDNVNANINYRFADTSGRELTADLDYGYYDNAGNQVTPNTYTSAETGQVLTRVNFRINQPTRIHIFSAKSDYEQKLWRGKLMAGFRVADVRTDNTFSYYNQTEDQTSETLNPDRSNRFRYTEQVQAAYLQYRREFGKWSLQGGLRAENTHSVGRLSYYTARLDSVRDRTYINFFPTGSIGYKLSDKHQFALSYSRRIDRPNYSQLNPFEGRIDELTFQRGNPYLTPQYTDQVELSHTFMGFITTSVMYSHVRDLFGQITVQRDARSTSLTPYNLATQDIVSGTLSTPFQFGKRYSGYSSLTYYYSKYRADLGEGKIINIGVPTFNVYQQHNLLLNNGYSLELSGWYQSKSVWEGAFRSQPMASIDFGMQKKMWQDRASLKLAVSDIFFTSRWNGTSSVGAVNINARGNWESRTVRLTFSYSFGQAQIKQMRRRNSADDLMNRAGGGGGQGGR